MIVSACVLFNAGLAAMNAHVTLTATAVIACEAVLLTSALSVAFFRASPYSQKWIALLGICTALAVVNGLVSGGIDPKFLRDVLVIPVFVLLGLSCSRSDVVRVVLPLQAIVLGVMIFEALRPDEFGRIFNVSSFYINTRGLHAEDFWNKSSDLFVSATRPGERFLLGGLGIHRLSSIFLEPVSLGNYCVVVAIVAASLWSSFTLPQRVFLVISELMILVGSDGRFASVMIGLIIVFFFLSSSLPHVASWFYLPGALVLAALGVSVLGISDTGDDFSGRVAGSVGIISRMSLTDLLGFNTFSAYRAMDSGIAYFLLSQSLIGVLVVWTFISLGLPQDDKPSIIATHAVSLYVTLLLLVSYSLFSVKTAALLWFSYGAIAHPVPRHRRASSLTPSFSPKEQLA